MISGMLYFISGLGGIGWCTALYQLRKTVRLETHFYELCLVLEEHLDSVNGKLINPVDRKLHSEAVAVYKSAGLID